MTKKIKKTEKKFFKTIGPHHRDVPGSGFRDEGHIFKLKFFKKKKLIFLQNWSAIPTVRQGQPIQNWSLFFA